MKKSLSFIVFMLSVFAMVSCVSEGSSSNNNNMSELLAQWDSGEPVKPDAFIGKTLEGTGGESTKYKVTYLFRADGTMTRTQDGVAAEGTWTFDAKKQMRKYTLDWTVGETRYGYIVDILLKDGTFTIYGDWYLTDVWKTISESLVEVK